MNFAHPYFPRSSSLHKGFGDFISLNPWNNLKDSIHALGQGPGGIIESGSIGLGVGQALGPNNLAHYAKVTINPNAPAYGYGDKGQYGAKPPAVPSATAASEPSPPDVPTLAAQRAQNVYGGLLASRLQSAQKTPATPATVLSGYRGIQ
jgi:hypothetical protein